MIHRIPIILLTGFAVVIGVLATVPLAAQTPACAAIDGVGILLAPKRVLLLGEIHGTAESPAFVGEIACHALAANLSVTVALELPQKDQMQLDTFLGKEGPRVPRDNLYSAFWRKSYQDGRTSIAMADLVDRLRRLSDFGSLSVVLIDRPATRQGRDEAMALKIAEVLVLSPNDTVIALTGNMHNRTVPGAPWNAQYKPMGYQLAQMVPDLDLLSLDVAHTGGTTWVCLSNQPCQEQELRGSGTRESFAAILYEEADSHGFHGVYEVGTIHASPPAAATP